MKKMGYLAVFALFLALAACGGNDGGSTAGSGDPARIVEEYFGAKIQSDEATVRRLLCAEMESVAEREVRSFDSVSDATLEDVACTFVADTNTVQCTGAIVALYGTEETRFPLTSYRVVQEDGEWKWCGEAP